MKILLHTCCAPCLIYPLEKLRQKGDQVVGLYYNPNIHPLAEYKNRKQAVEDYVRKAGVEMVYPEYKPAEYFQAVNMKEKGKERCVLCWTLRMRKSAEAGKARGCEAFTTTLLVSPYQDQEELKRIGNEAGKEFGIEFYYEDFRPGFKKAHEEARVKGIYCQKYCGCIYSEIERCKR
ncbi:MAG TPA: epoxyqueuosine reductase QueH [Candidatus Margulisiibacteriota bacterium]|nr:epoxyqueuosine reductase QueH [Candidatus Margulisiibacteriota bacterium]